jgi:hypothetical protein
MGVLEEFFVGVIDLIFLLGKAVEAVAESPFGLRFLFAIMLCVESLVCSLLRKKDRELENILQGSWALLVISRDSNSLSVPRTASSNRFTSSSRIMDLY